MKQDFFIWIRRNHLKSPNSTKGIQGNASLFIWISLFLLAFICMDVCAKRNALGSRTRLRSHRRRNLLPEGVRGLRRKTDGFERARGGADQFRIRGSAGAVG
jgi:hypothetical protein